MSRDTELLKIQAYADYAHSRYTVEASYLLGAIAAYIFTIFGLRLQNILSLEVYWLFMFVPIPFFAVMLYNTHRNYTRRMARVDVLIKNVNTMQSLPTLEDLINGKAWEKEKSKKS
jgi:hypothetical protein